MRSQGDIAFYADLRTAGSPEGLFLGDAVPATERAARLLADLLGQLHDALLQAAIEDDELITDGSFVYRIDALSEAISTIRVAGEIERQVEQERTQAVSDNANAAVVVGPQPQVSLSAGGESSKEERRATRETRRGVEQISLNFGQVAKALRELANGLATKRVWIVLDEWSSVPPDTQPYLAVNAHRIRQRAIVESGSTLVGCQSA